MPHTHAQPFDLFRDPNLLMHYYRGDGGGCGGGGGGGVAEAC